MTKLNILVVGSGGREHALAWKIKQSPLCGRLVCAPGNPGMATLAECRDVKDTDVAGQVALAKEIGAGLVVVGPESALAAGIADALAAEGIPCFGHSRKAAQIESSKAFLKAFAVANNVPTASYQTVTSAADANEFLRKQTAPFVIKADGLAAGKGVVIAETLAEANTVVESMLGGQFGAAGHRVVLEEFMQGEEASLFAFADGTSSQLFGGAQDHKRAYDGDLGPNTGGMGAYSPAPVLTEAVMEQARQSMIEPTVAGMNADGAPLSGVLFAGLMIENGAPRLVEYNARFGDPECQVLMLRLKSDIVPYLLAVATGKLGETAPLEWRDEAAICVVLAADGYPEAPVKGSIIRGADGDLGEGVTLFHAGTVRDADGTLRANGGRVLNVCALGRDLAQARDRAYSAIGRIDWPGGFHRSDIGWRALTR